MTPSRYHELSRESTTAAQLRVLDVTAAGASPMGAICCELCVGSAAMTGLVDKLEARGLVERVRDSGDRRKTRVRITDAGRAELERWKEMLR